MPSKQLDYAAFDKGAGKEAANIEVQHTVALLK